MECVILRAWMEVRWSTVRSVLFLGLLRDELSELRQDLVLALRSLFVVELGQSPFLVCTVNLVLFPKTNSLHSTMSAHAKEPKQTFLSYQRKNL